MPILLDIPIPIGGGDDIKPDRHYFLKSDHRIPGNPNKSQWIIKEDKEIECFQLSLEKGYLEETIGWGILENENGQLLILGILPKQEESKIARFEDSSSTCVWHGYPADCRNIRDRPSNKLLDHWRDINLIRKSQWTRLRKGKICSP